MEKITEKNILKFCESIDESCRVAEEQLECSSSIDRTACQMRCIALDKVKALTYIWLRDKELKNGK